MDVTTEYRQCIRTAKARASVVKAVQDIAAHYGAKVKESPYQDSGKERCLTVDFGPYHARVDLRGNSRNSAFVVPWFTDGQAKYPPAFIQVAGIGSINQCHHGKATGIVSNFGGLCMMLTEGLAMLAPIVRFEAAHMAMMAHRWNRDAKEYTDACAAREAAYRDLRESAGLPRNFAA